MEAKTTHARVAPGRITLTISLNRKVHAVLTRLAKKESRSKSAQANIFIEDKLRELKVL